MNREELILSLEPTVATNVKQAIKKLPYTAFTNFDDLWQVAWMGAIQAVDKFQEDRNVKLSSFADRRVKGAILDYLREIDPLSRSHRKKVKAGEEPDITILSLSSLKFQSREGSKNKTWSDELV